MPAYVDERAQHLVEYMFKPETAEFVGVTPVFEGGFMFVEDRPQSFADRKLGSVDTMGLVSRGIPPPAASGLSQSEHHAGPSGCGDAGAPHVPRCADAP